MVKSSKVRKMGRNMNELFVFRVKRGMIKFRLMDDEKFVEINFSINNHPQRLYIKAKEGRINEVKGFLKLEKDLEKEVKRNY